MKLRSTSANANMHTSKHASTTPEGDHNKISILADRLPIETEQGTVATEGVVRCDSQEHLHGHTWATIKSSRTSCPVARLSSFPKYARSKKKLRMVFNRRSCTQESVMPSAERALSQAAMLWLDIHSTSLRSLRVSRASSVQTTASMQMNPCAGNEAPSDAPARSGQAREGTTFYVSKLKGKSETSRQILRLEIYGGTKRRSYKCKVKTRSH